MSSYQILNYEMLEKGVVNLLIKLLLPCRNVEASQREEKPA